MKLFGFVDSIFDAREATNIGSSLGDFFIELHGSRGQPSSPVPTGSLETLYRRAEELTRGIKLGLYKKAKLANAFKWKLRESGIDTEQADKVSRELLLRLGFRTPQTTSSRPAALKASAQEDSHLSEGNAHFTAGRYEAAVASYRITLDKFPNDPYAHNNLGAALSALGRLHEAEASFQTSARLKQDYAEAYSNLGNTRRQLGKLEEAEQALHKALKVDPNYPDALSNLGLIQYQMSKFDEAEASFRKALSVDPNNAYSMIGLGHCMSVNGDFTEGERLYRQALEIDPNNPAAWGSLVGIRRMTAKDSNWLRTAEKMLKDNLSPQVESNLRSAIGKFCDDTHDFDRAFENYRRANELRKSFSPGYDREKMTKHVDALLQVYDATLAAMAKQPRAKSQRPVFVVGMMRSGTSLIEQILASHPSAYGAGEMNFWADSAPSDKKLKQMQKFETAKVRKLGSEYLEALSAISPNAEKVVDKATFNFMHLGLIHAALPNARIIHSQRNPIDTCLSVYFQNFDAFHSFANDLSDLNHFYKLYLKVMNHWRSTLPSESLLDVPYERLLEEPETWIRRILDFVGLDWDPRCLDFHQTKRRVGTASQWQVRQKLYTSSAGRWRHYEKHVGPLKDLEDLV